MNTPWTNRNFRRLIVWSSWRCITEREEAFVVFSFPRPWPVSKKGRTSGKKSGKATEFANVCSCTSSRATRASESTTKDRRFAQTSLDYERTSFLPLFPRIFFITPTSLLHWWNKIPYGLYNWQKKKCIRHQSGRVATREARVWFSPEERETGFDETIRVSPELATKDTSSKRVDRRARVGMETIAQDLCGIVSRNGARTTCRVLSRLQLVRKQPGTISADPVCALLVHVERRKRDGRWQSSCVALSIDLTVNCRCVIWFRLD